MKLEKFWRKRLKSGKRWADIRFEADFNCKEKNAQQQNKLCKQGNYNKLKREKWK